jgi:site-specific DNA recombinase
MSRNNGKRSPKQKQTVQCAVYCRVSTPGQSNGDYTSLDAQLEACRSFITSQKHEGWLCLPDHYSDAGFSGGTMERPELARLIRDIEDGRINCVVTYKVDRLSRSLLDFARLVEIFDKYGVTLSAVTQPINTGDSSGRLMLNVLLSFAQYERELISDRTSDKMSAARRRGRWTGGRPVLGYDLHPDGGKLVVNEDEAAQVREIFALYLEKRSLLDVAEELNRRGWTTKNWTATTGRAVGGQSYTKTRVHSILGNPVYVGKVSHRGEIYEGEHRGIVRRQTWDKVQSLLGENRQHGGSRAKNRYGHLLRGLVRCTACDAAYSPSVSRKGNKVYRYYVCSAAAINGWKSCPQPSLNAEKLEQAVVDQIRRIGEDPLLIKETVRQVREAKRSKKPVLVAEQKRLRREQQKVRAEIKKWLDAFAKGEVGGAEISNHVGLLEAKVRKLEERLTEIDTELQALADATVNQADVAKALSLFDPVWDVLFPAEQERIICLLIDRIDYDGNAGKMAIQFAPTGIRGLAGEIDDAQGEIA